MTPRLASDRGMALVAVLMLMLVMSGLVTGLAVSGRTELDMSTNEATYAATRAAAEAGMNHGVVLALDPGTSIPTLFLGPDGAINTTTPSAAVNADNGSLAHLIGGTGPWLVDAGDSRYSYTVRLVDDDDPSLFTVPLTDAELASMGEDGSGLLDTNGRFVIRASGFGPDGLRVNVETMLLPQALPAIVMNGNLTMSGSAKLLGTAGSVHVNGNLTISNTKVTVTKNATASGTYVKPKHWAPGGAGAGGGSTIAVPNIDANSYASEADLVLTSTGLIVDQATGATLCTATYNKQACKNSFGWTFTSATAGWNLNQSSGLAATYFVQGPATVSGSPGSDANPLRITVIATGSITVSGSPKIAPEATSGLLFVTNGDLRITGGLKQQTPEGRILVREQLQISGSAKLKAQLLVQNVTSVSNVVTANTISSSANLTYNATLPSQSYTAGGWREGQ